MEMAYRERWKAEIAEMRRVLAGLAMKEECKWAKPTCAPGKAWVRRKRCRRAETSPGTQAGAEPVRQRLTTSRKRVLRGCTTGQPGRKAAKRRQRANRPCD